MLHRIPRRRKAPRFTALGRGVARGRRTRRPAFEPLEGRQMLALWATPLISEFMASNTSAHADGDGNYSDWIEVFNPTDETIDLAGWHLTDNDGNLDKWAFPDDPQCVLDPGEYLVVFASNQPTDDYVDAGGHLHTNFSLSAGGEYLALTDPTETPIHEYDEYPEQSSNVSYGIVQFVNESLMMPENGAIKYLTPTAAVANWNGRTFNDASWSSGYMGIGYETSGDDFAPYIVTDTNPTDTLPVPNQTLYVRYTFTLDDVPAMDSFKLHVRYDDGFVAYLNGQKIAADRAPASPVWNSAADAVHHDPDAIQYVEFDVLAYRNYLVAGTNVVAIQLLNYGSSSTDSLLQAILVGREMTGLSVEHNVFMTTATPGAVNVPSGPAISDVTENPTPPADDEDLVIHATVAEVGNGLDDVTLYYRIDYASEVALVMLDNGLGADAAADDGIFTAVIPDSAYGPGDMVRWRVAATDAIGILSRAPLFDVRTGQNQSAEYFGTVVPDDTFNQDPAYRATHLDVLYWFVQDPNAARTDAGTRASLFYLGEFYDNVFVRRRGNTSADWVKRNYKFDFGPDQRFKYAEGQPRVEEFNLNSTYSDKAYIRQVLSAEVFRDAGAAYGEAFPLRVQQNGLFHSVAVFVQQVDEEFLEQNGLDEDGALYKMFNQLESTSGAVKQTRLDEDMSDLQALVNGVSPSNANRNTYLFDNVDIPAVINHIVARVLIHDNDHVQKNYYLYRDTEGTGLWQFLPWDLDLTWGRNYGAGGGVLSDGIWADDDPYSHPDFGDEEHKKYDGLWNRLIDAIHDNPVIEQMYLRRLRTLMDELLQPPGTPSGELLFEQRINELYTKMASDVALDRAKWGNPYGENQTFEYAINVIKTQYLAVRRTHLYTHHGTQTTYPDYAGIPAAQVGNPTIHFGTIEFAPASGNQDQEYIQLTNPNSVAVDVSGWTITGGVELTFKPGTVIPAGGSIYVSPDIAAFRLRTTGPRGGQQLLVVGDYDGHLSSLGETLTLRGADGALVEEIAYPGNPSPAQLALRISEVNYNPLAPTAAELAVNPALTAGDFEFIELVNTGSQSLALSGVSFTSGIQYTFGAASLGAGSRIIVAKNPTAFAIRYNTAGMTVVGPFAADSSLDNGGETITLDDATGSTVVEFKYNNAGAWPGRANGMGGTIELWDFAGDPADAGSWRGSIPVGGTPGAVPEAPKVLVNEVLTHTDLPLSDAIELVNVSGAPINIGGWYLSDTLNDLLKFQIPADTWLAPGQYITFDESDFNASLGVDPDDFALNSAEGDDVWLVEVDAQGTVLRFADHMDFGAAANGVSFGLWPDATAYANVYPMKWRTLGTENAGPYIGPVVISEIQYNPGTMVGADDLEYIEIHNWTNSIISLEGWRLSGGIDYVFGAGETIAPRSTRVIVRFDPSGPDPIEEAKMAAFLSHYAPSGTVTFSGPYTGKLDNGGEVVRLERPDEPPLGQPEITPWILEDRVGYDDASPWAIAADGQGGSLQRVSVMQWATDAANWAAGTPTPGATSAITPGPGDITLDGWVDRADAAVLAAHWLASGNVTWTDGDFNGDGHVDDLDLAVMAANWHEPPTAPPSSDATSTDPPASEPIADVTDPPATEPTVTEEPAEQPVAAPDARFIGPRRMVVGVALRRLSPLADRAALAAPTAPADAPTDAPAAAATDRALAQQYGDPAVAGGSSARATRELQDWRQLQLAATWSVPRPRSTPIKLHGPTIDRLLATEGA
ncbi:MAG: lamin tail domain-containing protein [Pirellulales bacterium]|nr:lamin tail domain-containing protein [Pirellulales bacterium]